ncbi:hypothetical protein DFQ04_2365 [Algoriphagus boseongensis]|uniref:Uncharacterized protein n=1 Tax=Algoriphagus boseongensis TaxID=1442587 RepID=A0A4V3D203_9BACT|nr:hypothetical protein [Algoriphagus boseongensis]TDQ16253.1 hypothetical protein DFQ04_2365 [Algoriphagus boseongensis]
MKKIAFYLQIALLIFFLVFLMFFIFFDTLGSTFGMDPILAESMVKVFLTGTIVFLAAWGAMGIHQSGLNDKIKKMESEMNALKAKLYDLEHPKTKPGTNPIPQKNQEDSTGPIRPRQNFTDQ